VLAEQPDNNIPAMFQVKFIFWSKTLDTKFSILFHYRVSLNEIIDYINNESRGLIQAKNTVIKPIEIVVSSLSYYNNNTINTGIKTKGKVSSKKTKPMNYETILNSIDKNDNIVEYDDYTEYNEYDD
jgi:hypothetical protein